MIHQLKIRQPDDFHVHLRRDERLHAVLRYTAQVCGRALVMPNTGPPILTAQDAQLYREEIKRAAAQSREQLFEPLMTLYLTDNTTPEMIDAAADAGVVAVKAYPRGKTTNAEQGVADFLAPHLMPVYKRIQKHGLRLSIHGENPRPKLSCLIREQYFLETLRDLATRFADLKIIMEHISTASAVVTVRELGENVGATITPHHLILTIDDVVGQPHNFCKPVAQKRPDREMLRQAATSGNPKFFAGSDSAPHWKNNKEGAIAEAGCFTAPVMMAIYAQVFEEEGSLDLLEDFTSRFGAEFYDHPYNQRSITLVRKPWVVPHLCNGVVPFMAGHKLDWQVQDFAV